MESKNIFYYYEAIQYFWQNAQLKLYQGQVPINLMNLFPLLKQGYDTSNTHHYLILNYNIINNLFDTTNNNYIIPDDLYNQAFNGNIPAQYFAYIPIITIFPSETFVPMEKALLDGLVSKPLNIFETMSITYEDFNSNRIHAKYIPNISWIDYDETEVNKTMINDLDKENTIARNINVVIHRSTRNMESPTLESFIINIDKIEEDSLLNALLSDEWIKLLYGIIFNDEDIVSRSTIDPRINNNEAYKLALKYKNPEIIRIIEDKIARRRWLEQEAITNLFETIVGTTNISKSLFSTREY